MILAAMGNLRRRGRSSRAGGGFHARCRVFGQWGGVSDSILGVFERCGQRVGGHGQCWQKKGPEMLTLS